MKNLLKLLLLLVCSSVTQTALSLSLRQDSVRTAFVGSKIRTTFYVYAPVNQNYSLKFWVMGVKHDSAANSTYDVGVDNSFVGNIRPDSADWCLAVPYNVSSVYLTEGTHRIYLEGPSTDVPNAEAVVSSNLFLPPGYNSNITYNSCYENMKKHLGNPSYIIPYNPDTLITNYRQINYHPVEQDTLTPPFHYSAELNKKVYYTFCRLEYYQSNETVIVNADTEDDLQMMIHIISQDGTSFSATSPVSSNTWNSLSCEIPTSGFYYVIVRSYNPNEWGTCNVSIQNSIYYTRFFENVPVNCSRTIIESPAYNKDYACFAMSNNGDPMIFLMNSGNGGEIVRYNDDFSSPQSHFDWQKNARVDGQLSSGQWIFTLTKSFPSLEEKKCDIYTRCEKNWFRDPDLVDYGFDDYIISSAETPTPPWYNCLSWALDEWLEGMWFDGDYDNNECVDTFLVAYGYVPDISESTTTLDMWAQVYPNGEFEYCHASVKSKGHPHAAGYAWESKLADSFRVFHGRYALEGGEWGEVIRHYKKSNINQNLPDPDPYPGGPVFLNVNLTGDEFGEIENGIQLISQDLTAEFSNLYEECKANGSKMVTIFIDSYEKTESYKQLLDFCVENPVLCYLLYKKICEGEILAIKLLKDYTLSGSRSYLWKEAVDNVRLLCNKKSDVKCLHTARAYGMYLIKLLLSSPDYDPSIAQNISYSNSPVLQVRTVDGHIYVSFDLDANAVVSLYLGNTDGTITKQILNKQLLEKGTHSYNYQIPKSGYYTIGLIANGSVYRKTLITY